MAGYSPLYIKGMETGLVQSRQEFILPDDAYPTLENAYVWRERLKRKQGFELLGRLQRNITVYMPNQTDGSNLYTTTDVLVSVRINEPDAQLQPGNVIINIAPNVPAEKTVFNDVGGTGVLNYVSGPSTISSGSVNYTTGQIILNFTVNPIAVRNVQLVTDYYPCLPVMGLRSRELNSISNEQLIAFDQIYAYRFLGSAWQEFIPGTTWTGTDSDFFWSTNYWVNVSNQKLFWVTNFSTSDPIRYSDGTVWTDFAPFIDLAKTMQLFKCLCLLPFRGRLVAFNTFEGPDIGNSVQQFQRIRWAAIGNPIPDGLYQPWNSDVRGKGGFLDIPTSESIVSVGFVRDNLVIYCERSTWQLRYTGRSIAPFQIEKVNSELGASSTFSAVQFDTSLVGIGDKGVVECDSFKSERIDIKIPDLIYTFNNNNFGTKRVQGIRNFQKRLAFWIYPLGSNNGTFPDRRLVYNYENDSWATYTDSLTALGTYQAQTSITWIEYEPLEDSNTWQEQNAQWVDKPALFPFIVGGNQQGYVEKLDVNTGNDVSLFIKDITGFGILPTDLPVVIESPNHNLQTGQIIKIYFIPTGTPFASELNEGIYQITRGDNSFLDANNKFVIKIYDPQTEDFTIPALAPSGTYIGGGQAAIRDNFSIISKKFNFLEDGQNIQMGFIDVLLDKTERGAISLNVYQDYNNDSPVNKFPENELVGGLGTDTFFNQVVPTTTVYGLNVSKNWQRVFCPVRGAFITIEWTLSNAQMIGDEQESDVQIDSQILWLRKAGRQLPVGF